MSFGGYALGAGGEFAECGVFQGGTALLLSRLLKGTQKRLHLFDSFQGLPQLNALDKDVFKEGQYAGNIDAVRNLLSEFGEDVVIHRGWIPQTFAGLEDKNTHLSVLMLICIDPISTVSNTFIPMCPARSSSSTSTGLLGLKEKKTPWTNSWLISPKKLRRFQPDRLSF
jgi:hypothetical protein